MTALMCVSRWAYWRARLHAICDETVTKSDMEATHVMALKLLDAMDKSEATATMS